MLAREKGNAIAKNSFKNVHFDHMWRNARIQQMN